MQPSLLQAKKRLSDHFLGKAGIHGLGVSTARQAIRVYVDQSVDPELFSSMLIAMKRLARPFEVIVVPEESPSIKAA
jgi:hypothetical protein